MAYKIPTATNSSMATMHGLVPEVFEPRDIVQGWPPIAHITRWFFLCCWQAAQWQCPFLSVKFTEKHVFFKSLAHSPASPEPELPLDCGV
ncbi:MAG: hypothetical protein [Anelloviridae sp.]|nr:MAG: hypothetical protein [Anelloviridae sp.]